MASLVYTASLFQLFMKSGLTATSSSQGLIVWEDNRIGLGITFMSAIFHPPAISNGVWMETCAVEAKKIYLRRACHDPFCELSANTTAQHHSHGVETTGVVKATKPRMRTHQWLVVRSEGLGSAHRGLNPDGLNHRAALHVPFQILTKGVPVKLEKPECKAWVHVRPELWVLLITANGHGITLSLQIHAEIVISDVWQTTMHAFNRLSENHGVLHCHQRYLNARHLTKLVCPGPASVHHSTRLDASSAGCANPQDSPCSGSPGCDVVFCVNASYANILEDLPSQLSGGLGICVCDAGWVDGAIPW
mmetsp:Transcript_2147/g.4028  ORF Transcript_2147/g.4028 Transcript_2147/m.4028 type:complete len:305 (-) Transcript_2147:561-1475(-)